MKFMRQVVASCICIGSLTMGAVAYAASSAKDLVLNGDAVCTTCHDEGDNAELLAIGKTKHGTRADSRTPTCTSCHGTSLEHRDFSGSGKPPKPDVTYGKVSKTTAVARNETCLTCHQQDSKRHMWAGSAHDVADVACSSCHKVHVSHDPVRDKLSQSEVCYTCHKAQRAQFSKPSHHPTPEGKVACSDCHNTHGSAGPKLMVRDSVSATCYTCHMEKRGPFVHSHQPVAEDCSNCHNPHGTVAESLLKARAPFLCNSCHTPHGPIQPTLANGTAPTLAVPGWWNASVVTQGKSCVSCHAQIHGSNNPGSAGQRFLR